MTRSDRHSNMQARKELLLARSSIERMELAGHMHRLRADLSPASIAKSVWPRLTASGGAATAMQVWRFLRRYPIVSSAASMLLARLRPRGLFRLVKLGGAAFAGYQAYRLWQAIKQDAHQRPPRAAVARRA